MLMSNKVNRKGRNTQKASFIQLHRWMLDSDAWKSLSVYSRCLYLEIKRRYYGANNGGISFSHREAEKLLNCSNKPVMKAFRELQEKGFIKPQQKGAFKGVPFATTWIITEAEQDIPIKSLIATKEFMSWKPSQNSSDEKKARHAQSTLTARRKHTAGNASVCPEHTDSVPKSHRNGQNDASSSMPEAHTYSIPYTQAAQAGGRSTTAPSQAACSDTAQPLSATGQRNSNAQGRSVLTETETQKNNSGDFKSLGDVLSTLAVKT